MVGPQRKSREKSSIMFGELENNYKTKDHGRIGNQRSRNIQSRTSDEMDVGMERKSTSVMERSNKTDNLKQQILK